MARIRSTHPEQWTDDQFVTCSVLARLLALALRNFADDNGIFEWNPVKLKMRCLPADNCDVGNLLDELAQSGQVLGFEVLGKAYGIIRNFTKFQKPRKPTTYYPVPPEPLGNGYETPHKSNAPNTEPRPPPRSPSTEPVRNQFGNSSSEGVGVGVVEDSEAKASGEQVAVPPDEKTEAPTEPPTARLPTNDDERKKAAFALARTIGRPSAPSELLKAAMSWEEILATLMTAKSKADPPSYLAKRINQLTQSGEAPAKKPYRPKGMSREASDEWDEKWKPE